MLPGKPDIAITKYRIAVFCDTEFFHGKDWEKLKLRLRNGSNSAYWIKKITRNRERDDEVGKALRFMEWTVLRFCGEDIKNHIDDCVKVVEEMIMDYLVNKTGEDND